MHRWRESLSLWILLTGALWAQDSAEPVEDRSRRLLLEGKPLSGYLLLHVEDMELASKLHQADLGRYLDGEIPIEAVRQKWTHLLRNGPARLTPRFQRFIAGLPTTFPAPPAVKAHALGSEIPVVIVDPSRNVFLDAFLRAMGEIGGATDLSRQEKVNIITRLIRRRISSIGEENGPHEIVLAGTGPTRRSAEALALVKNAIERAGIETHYVSNGPKYRVQTTVEGLSEEAKEYLQKETQVPFVEVRIEGNDIKIAGPIQVLESASQVVKSPPPLLADAPPQVRFLDYPAGRKVHVFGPSGGVIPYATIAGPEGDRFRVTYGSDSRQVTRAELDLLNAPTDFPAGTLIRAAPHFARVRERTRCDVLIDPSQDPLLRAYLAEVGTLGRATSIPEQNKIDLLLKITTAWMNASFSGPVTEVETRFHQLGQPARIGEFIKAGGGVCRHKAILAARGLQEMGFHQRYVSGSGHASCEVIQSNGARGQAEAYGGTFYPKSFGPKIPEDYLKEIIIEGRDLFQRRGGRPNGIPAPQNDRSNAPGRSWIHPNLNDYVLAEKSMRELLKDLGISTENLRVTYRPLGPHEPFGKHHDGAVTLNLDRYPRSVKSVFHELWHFVQQTGEGRPHYRAEYLRHPYNVNPYEMEARLVANRLHDVYTRQATLPWFRTGDFTQLAPGELRSALGQIRNIWNATDLPEATRSRLQMLEARIDALARLNASRVRSWTTNQVKGAGIFAGGILVRQAIKAVEVSSHAPVTETLSEMTTPRFWGSLGVFSAAAQSVHATINRLGRPGRWTTGLSHAVLPLSAGMAATQIVSGEFEPRAWARSSLAYSAAGALVQFPLDLAMKFIKRRQTALYRMGSLGLSLYLGEKIDRRLSGESFPDRHTGSSSAGVQERIDRVNAAAATRDP